eukprot:628617-Prymnesium_polylepis.2
MPMSRKPPNLLPNRLVSNGSTGFAYLLISHSSTDAIVESCPPFGSGWAGVNQQKEIAMIGRTPHLCVPRQTSPPAPQR